MGNLWKFVGQTHNLQDTPSPGPYHDTCTNLFELACSFVHFDVNIGVSGKKNCQRKSAYTTTTKDRSQLTWYPYHRIVCVPDGDSKDRLLWRLHCNVGKSKAWSGKFLDCHGGLSIFSAIRLSRPAFRCNSNRFIVKDIVEDGGGWREPRWTDWWSRRSGVQIHR